MPAKLWLQFVALILGSQWLLGLMLWPLHSHASLYAWSSLAAAALLLGLLWRVGLVFRNECGRLQVRGGLRLAESLLVGLIAAAPVAVHATTALSQHAGLRWLLGPIALAPQSLAHITAGAAAGRGLLIALAVGCLLLFWVPAGLSHAPAPKPVVRTQPVALTPAPKVQPRTEIAAAEADNTWKPARRFKDVAGRERPGRLPPRDEDE